MDVRKAVRTASLVVVLASAAYVFWPEHPVKTGPGVLAPRDPVQKKIAKPKPFWFGDYTLTPRATFDLRARVLGKKRYRFGQGSDICPVDLAMGWGGMSDESVLEGITIDQYRRHYVWGTHDFPIPRREIETHSANMHIIPANDEIRRRVLACRVGHVVHFIGVLVDVKHDNGYFLTTSLTREDTGDNACEIIFVTKCEVVDTPQAR